MSLHLSLSTTCPNADSSALHVAACPGDWRSTGMAVEFFFRGRYGSIEQLTAEIGKQINNQAGYLPVVELQLDQPSGRYRRKVTVPI